MANMATCTFSALVFIDANKIKDHTFAGKPVGICMSTERVTFFFFRCTERVTKLTKDIMINKTLFRENMMPPKFNRNTKLQ